MRLLTPLFLIASLTSFAQVDSLKIDSAKVHEVGEVVITASRKEEKLMQSPVSIEKLELRDIRQSAQPSFFDAIENLKGVQMITPSLGFKVINARGFTNTTNVRFIQMVDGMDNQAPHIGAPIANSMGPTDLDIYRVEVVPGSASAVYGMNAINGTANFITKDPFLFSGLSVQHKFGVNHVNHTERMTPFNETSLRYAKSFDNKWAFKVNGTFMKGTDWHASNQTDLNPNANTSTNLTGQQNPGSDLVNTYGDESSNRKNLTLGNKQYMVSRTGYAEKDVTDYSLQNLKGDASIYYKPKSDIELSYLYRVACLNTTYQRTNRFRLDDYLTQQHGIAFKSPSIQFKTYMTSEKTGRSYNIRSMAENIDRSYKSDDQWFKDFGTQFVKETSTGSSIVTAMSSTRAFADNGRPQVGTQQYSALLGNLRSINNWDVGAALQVQAYLSHAEAQHDLTQVLLPWLREKYGLNLMYGGDFRNYMVVPDGNYFINPTNPDNNLNYWKIGGFVQITNYFLQGKLKVNAVLRLDKSQYFAPKLNPRLAVVYSPVKHHNIRASLQHGYRYPSLFEAFSNINSGGVKRVGGLPIMSNGIFENTYLRTSVDAFQNAVTNDINKNGYTLANAITKNQGLLKRNNYTYLQPEQVTSLEVGYRTELFSGILKINADFYYNIYKNLLAQVEANIPKTNNPDSIATYLTDKKKQDRYRLWTNSKTITYNFGGTFGISLQLPNDFKLNGNATYAKLDRKEQTDGLEEAFNTPEWMYNLNISNPKVFKQLGFLVNYRWQMEYLWQSSLATGQVPAYSTLDAQVNYALRTNMHIKIGASNLLNTYYYSFIGGPSVGGFYYCTVLYEVF